MPCLELLISCNHAKTIVGWQYIELKKVHDKCIKALKDTIPIVLVHIGFKGMNKWITRKNLTKVLNFSSLKCTSARNGCMAMLLVLSFNLITWFWKVFESSKDDNFACVCDVDKDKMEMAKNKYKTNIRYEHSYQLSASSLRIDAR